MILYHYCSTEAFRSIISTGSIRLSMLDMSNDSLEGRWVHGLLQKLIEEREDLKAYAATLMTQVEIATSFSFAGGFFLSEEHDQLSQWRGYADDGCGFAIGFDSDYLKNLGAHYRDNYEKGFGLSKVLYGERECRPDLKKIVDSMQRALNKGALRHVTLLEAFGEEREKRQKEIDSANNMLFMAMSPLSLICHHIKNPAFSEEREWRLISVHMDIDGINLSVEETCAFRGARDRLVPYREVSLRELGSAGIKEVIVGPKNITRKEYLSAFLRKHGCEDVQIKLSAATYR